MNARWLLTVILCFFSLLSVDAKHKVYLVHGYGGLSLQFHKMYRAIRHEGYDVEKYSYKSISKDIDSIGMEFYRKIESEHLDTVSFVTHSMGALVVRSMYRFIDTSSSFPVVSRIVMIAPPNRGSRVADFFSRVKMLHFILGPNIHNLTTDECIGACKYPIPHDTDIGVIIAGTGMSWGFNIFMKGDNDGLVSPESTVIGVEKEVVFVKSTHNFILYKREVIRRVISFLKRGTFGS